MVATVVTVVIFGGLFGIGLQSVGQAFLLGLVIALVAPIGDLFESMIKRDLGVKDMGSVLRRTGACSIASTPTCSPCPRRTTRCACSA